MEKNGNNPPSVTLFYSLNGGKKWESFIPGTTIITLSRVGKSVCFVSGEEGNARFADPLSTNDWSFKLTGQIAASGSIMSLVLPYPSFSLNSYCFFNLFKNCTSLTSAPELPATSLSNYCYYGLFSGCINLMSAPLLPAMTMAESCYSNMFEGCVSLTTPPTLQSTTVAYSCYAAMFYGCTSLRTTPTLPATTLANSCYRQMFSNCTSLVSAPELPAETLAKYCYSSMFSGCTSLTQAPLLQATTLAESCYTSMFRNCSSLTTAPELPATTFASYCYERMFDGCSSLRYIKIANTNVFSNSSYTPKWVNGVASEGVFEITTFNFSRSLPTNVPRGVNACPEGWEVINTEEMVYIGSNRGGDKIKFVKNGAPPDINIVYSTDKNTWATYDTQTCPEIALPIYLKAGSGGNASLATDLNNYWHMSVVTSGTGKLVYIYGYPRSLLNAETKLQSLPSYALYNLFSNDPTLAYCQNVCLPSTTMAPYCYAGMFNGCTNMQTAPELPSTIMADHCYSGMFQGCSSLTSEMNLPATTLANGCYADMFNGCSLLNRISVGFNAWGSSNATSNWVSNVAQDGTFTCPAALGTMETIERGVSRCPVGWTVKMVNHAVMFIAEEAGCVINMTSEQSGSTPIPSLSLECSRDGISWTDFDTSSAHATPITLTNINDIVLFRAKNQNTAFSSADDTAWNWFTTSKRCKVRGNVMALLNGQNEDLTTISDVFALAYLFYECKITDASELRLPATTLANNCYQYMFGSCAYLVAVPELPATTLANYCY